MSQAPVNEEELVNATRSEDGYVANISAVNRMVHQGKSFSGHERNCVFLNKGAGKFIGVSALSGWDFPDDSRGLALTDWDFDGKIDFWVSNRNAPRIRLMRNDLPEVGNWIGFRLQGAPDRNRSAIGARVKVTLKGGRVIMRTLKAGEGFASQSTKTLHLGLGKSSDLESLSVVWPDGVTKSYPPPPVNRYYVITHDSQSVEPLVIPERSERKSLAGSTRPAPRGGVRVRLRVPIPAPYIRYRSFAEPEAGSLVAPSRMEKPLLVTLWSESCQDCRRELRELVDRRAEIGSHLDVLALCIDGTSEARAKGREFLKEINFPWQAGVPEEVSNSVLSAIFTNSLVTLADLPTPSALLISKSGDVRVLYQKELQVAQVLKDSRFVAEEENWLQVPGRVNLLYLPRILMEDAALPDATDYISRAHKQLSDHKEYPLLLVWMADELRKREQLEMAAQYYQIAARLGQNSPVVLNNVAWVLATHKEGAMRNGALAVECAKRCVQLTAGKNPGYLDTLAAAYAEAGNFDLALATAKVARQGAAERHLNELLPGLDKAISLYAEGKPMRE